MTKAAEKAEKVGKEKAKGVRVKARGRGSLPGEVGKLRLEEC